MIKACDLKRGSMVSINDAPHVLDSLKVSSPTARGSASLYRCRFRNLVNGHKVDQTLKGDDMLKDADFDKREVQFIFKQGDEYTFMDLESYDQFTLRHSDIEYETNFLIEDLEGITALCSDGRVLTIQMPDTVVMEVVECDPSIKGASATARSKPATLSTGHIVQVPEYMASGEMVKVDTRTGKYLSRA